MKKSLLVKCGTSRRPGTGGTAADAPVAICSDEGKETKGKVKKMAKQKKKDYIKARRNHGTKKLRA